MAAVTSTTDLVGIVDGEAVAKELHRLAKKIGQVTWDMTVYATLATVSLRKARLQSERERMQLEASSDSVVKLAFGIARYAAPRIADALRNCTSHEAAVKECRVQLDAMRGDLPIQSFYKSLRPESSRPVREEQPVAEVVAWSPTNAVAYLLADGCDFSAIPLDTLAKLQAVIQAAITGRAVPEQLAA